MSLQIHYTVSMPVPESHRFHVEVEIRGWTVDHARAILPVWAPGSYLVREFARHVEAFHAETLDGTPLSWHRPGKATWQVATEHVTDYRLRYEVYANDLTVRTSHLDSRHGYFNGTNLFLYLDGYKEHPLTLEIVEPAGWHSSIALPQNEQGYFVAPNYDILADSPAEIGTHRVLHFEALGKSHEIALSGEGNEDEVALVRDLKATVDGVASMFGSELPYERYLFIVHMGDRIGGGLEHRDSTTLAVDRWTFKPQREYEKFLRLAVHEFFHTWNVKRIRPIELGPFDYTQEVYTPLLWVMEGFTTYYDVVLLARSGLVTANRALELLGERIASYLQQPGRLIQSLEESSFTTWIKFYRQDENYINSGISYYLKGSLVALMLDLHLRATSDNETSLDDLMRYLWHTYGKRDVGFTTEEFWAAVRQMVGNDFVLALEGFVRGVDDLPLESYLGHAGLIMQLERKAESPAGWLGIVHKAEQGKLAIKNVLRDSPGEVAGLMAEDRLVAIDGYEIRDEAFLTARLTEKVPGDKVRLHLFRSGLLQEHSVTLGQAPLDKVAFWRAPNPTSLQRRILESWLAPVT